LAARPVAPPRQPASDFRCIPVNERRFGLGRRLAEPAFLTACRPR